MHACVHVHPRLLALLQLMVWDFRCRVRVKGVVSTAPGCSDVFARCWRSRYLAVT